MYVWFHLYFMFLLFWWLKSYQFLQGTIRHSPDVYLDEMKDLLEERIGKWLYYLESSLLKWIHNEKGSKCNTGQNVSWANWSETYSSSLMMLLRETRIKEHCFGYIMASATQQNKQFLLMKALLTNEHQSMERLGHYLGNVQCINPFLFVEESKWFTTL